MYKDILIGILAIVLAFFWVSCVVPEEKVVAENAVKEVGYVIAGTVVQSKFVLWNKYRRPLEIARVVPATT